MKLGAIAAMALGVGMLGGCQSITYEKAGAAPQQVEADTKACQEYQLRRWIAMGGNYVENMDRLSRKFETARAYVPKMTLGIQGRF